MRLHYNDKVKIFGVRMSLIGDSIMSLPILDYLKDQYPNSYIYFSLAKKCQQAKFLFESHPLIDEVKITDFDEDLGQTDFEIIKNCDIFINPKPNHPKEQDWYNYRSCVEETFLMAGLNLENLKTKPKLKLDYHVSKIPNSISVWPVAGYGRDFHRSPSKSWWVTLLSNFKNVQIHQFGSKDDFILDLPNVVRHNDENFKDQVLKSLSCSTIIGTDSGSMWATGAFGLVPQINLLTNWLPNHNKNFLALAPEGERCFNIFAMGSCDNIPINFVQTKISEILNNEKL